MNKFSEYVSVQRHGFTLLELLIVSLLISISLALSIPSLRDSLVSDELGSGSRQLLSLITSCRSKASATRTPYLIHYDALENRAWYQPADTGETDTANSPTVTLPSSVHIRTIQQSGADSPQSGPKNSIWVSKQGYMDKTLIQLTDENNRIVTLLISPFLPDYKVVEDNVPL